MILLAFFFKYLQAAYRARMLCYLMLGGSLQILQACSEYLICQPLAP